MLDPDGRLTLLDALRPPAGFALGVAIGATYSLRLDAALLVPAAMAGADTAPSESGFEPVGLLAALKRVPERVSIFHQAGRLGAERRAMPTVACLEQCLFPVAMPRRDAESVGFAFHPKFWVLRFDRTRNAGDDEPEERFRILCQSRNLTWDRSWDTLVRLDSSSDHPRTRSPVDVRALAEFVAELPARALGGVPERRTDEIRRVAEAIRKAWWPAPQGFDSGEFHAFGLGSGRRRLPFPEGADRVAVVSPFLREELVRRLPPARRRVIVSRPSEFATCREWVAKEFSEGYVLDASAVQMPFDDDGAVPFDGVHAKVFVFDVGRTTHVFSGSANATNAAFAGNAEVLVELRGPRERFGVDALLARGVGENLALRDFLVPVDLSDPAVPDGAAPSDPDVAALEGLAREIAEAQFTATAQRRDPARWQVTYRTPTVFTLPRGLNWTCRPISTSASSASTVVRGGGFSVGFDVAEHEITAFLVHELRLRDAVVSFTTAAEVIGAPDDRIDHVLFRLIGNVDRLMNMIEALLGDDDGFGSVDSDNPHPGGTGSSSSVRGTAPLLERLVRTLGPHPERVVEVYALLDRVASDPDSVAGIDAGSMRRLRSVVEPIARAAGCAP